MSIKDVAAPVNGGQPRSGSARDKSGRTTGPKSASKPTRRPAITATEKEHARKKPTGPQFDGGNAIRRLVTLLQEAEQVAGLWLRDHAYGCGADCVHCSVHHYELDELTWTVGHVLRTAEAAVAHLTGSDFKALMTLDEEAARDAEMEEIRAGARARAKANAAEVVKGGAA